MNKKEIKRDKYLRIRVSEQEFELLKDFADSLNEPKFRFARTAIYQAIVASLIKRNKLDNESLINYFKYISKNDTTSIFYMDSLFQDCGIDFADYLNKKVLK